MIWNFETAMILDDVIDKLEEIRKKHGGKIKVAFDSDEEGMQYPILNIYTGKVADEKERFVVLTDIEDIEYYKSMEDKL